MWIKICGIQDDTTYRHAVSCGADAIGLNFFAKSRRFVPVDVAEKIVPRVESAPPGVVRPAHVAVLVNPCIEEIDAIVQHVGVNYLQFHGDETPEDMACFFERFPQQKWIRAWRLAEGRLDPLEAYLQRCRQLGVRLDAVLIDSHVTGEYGGSGRTAPWDCLVKWPAGWPRLILAGGLTPENVEEAIATVRPWGIDVASGVEQPVGVKSPELIEKFIVNARKIR